MVSNKLAFMVSDLSASQLAYTLLKEANWWLEKDWQTEISVFQLDNKLPCIQPHFGRYHASDVMMFDGKLVATDLKSALHIKEATRADRYYYIIQMEDLNNPEMKNILENDSIKKFTRSNSYRTHLENQGFDISPIIVEHFDMDKILEIVNG